MTEQTSNEAMGEARLARLIEAYGANPARWPSEERGSAVRLTEADPERWASPLAAARRFDEILGQAPALAPGWPLVARILAAAPSRGPVHLTLLPHRRLLLSGGLAACAAGVLFGLYAATAPLAPAASSDVGAVASLLLTDSAEG